FPFIVDFFMSQLFSGKDKNYESIKDLLTSAEGEELSSWARNHPKRHSIIVCLRDRYRFFHPMLEFLEVFWLRDGFDIICGNPPWIKLQFDDKDVMSERFPEVVIHKLSAPEARAKKAQLLADPKLSAVYVLELLEIGGQSAFLNAYINYPLLAGQQTNLYKCILVNSFDLASENGYIGLLTPESIYDDPNGQPLRRELYKRLRYHFQYNNELRLFPEVHHHTAYGDQLLGPRSSSPRFASISNLFHPDTIYKCFTHNGVGQCKGIKDVKGKWNTEAHRDRIVSITENELKVLATLNCEEEWASATMVPLHSVEIVNILKKIGSFKYHIDNKENIIERGFEETSGVNDGHIQRITKFPNWDLQEMIYSGPHFYVGNPVYKTPRLRCTQNSDYDVIDLESISDDYSVRTNYIPAQPLMQFRNEIKGFQIGQDENGAPIYECWMDYYKVAIRKMTGGGSGERTLTGAILPPKSSQIEGVRSIVFKSTSHIVELGGLLASLPFDFLVKTMGMSNLTENRIAKFPLGIEDRFKNSLFIRALRLNCLTNRYADLWSECWDEEYRDEQWSLEDQRLAPWSELTSTWCHYTPLRNYFERRLALVEIDVLAAMALGLTLDELIMMYDIQFPVLQQNEKDTWYDRNGRIVFTCSKGLNGVGVDRKTWDAIKGNPIGDPVDELGSMAYEGVSPTYDHTLTSELYAGRVITYEAPYDRCDRIADYRRAWSHFSHLLNPQNPQK
ncbi:MAG: type II restriction endonuclease subunit M, partial [Bacteroidales bacterium]|nr:type II restriction endonuclease subunit M [Bacteroidales bacterium]